jgi:nucleoside-diphosphate kinase
MQNTLVLVKPDGVQRGLVGAILARFEAKGLQLVGLRLVRPDRALLEAHYAVHRERPFFASLLAFMGSGPVVAAALRGPDAVAVVRRMMGPTNGLEAPAGTIRGDHGLSKSFNLVHGSDAPEAAAAELALWFPDGLVEGGHHAARWLHEEGA